MLRHATFALLICADRPRSPRRRARTTGRSARTRTPPPTPRSRPARASSRPARPRAPTSPSPTTTARSRTARRTTTRRALADYNESIRINPKYAKAFNNRGNIWKDKGDLDRAIADYNEAIKLDREIRARLRQSRRRLGRQGRPQPRHRGPRPGDPPRSEIFARLQRARRGVEEEGRSRPRHRGLHRGDPATIRSRRSPTPTAATPGTTRATRTAPSRDLTEAMRLNPNYARAYNIRGVINRNRNNLDRAHRGLHRSDPLRPAIRARLPQSRQRLPATAATRTAPSRTIPRRSGSIRNPTSPTCAARRHG